VFEDIHNSWFYVYIFKVKMFHQEASVKTIKLLKMCVKKMFVRNG